MIQTVVITWLVAKIDSEKINHNWDVAFVQRCLLKERASRIGAVPLGRFYRQESCKTEGCVNYPEDPTLGPGNSGSIDLLGMAPLPIKAGRLKNNA